jgi:hypothetical protein
MFYGIFRIRKPMMYSLVIGIGILVAMMLGWTLVQALWRTSFREEISEEDVLAARSDCGNCGCGSVCKKRINEEKL